MIEICCKLKHTENKQVTGEHFIQKTYLKCMYTFKLASSSLLKIGQETDKTTTRNRESVYLLLDMVSLIFIFSNNKEVPVIPDCLFLGILVSN